MVKLAMPNTWLPLDFLWNLLEEGKSRDLQAQRHAPGLKVVVYDGVSRKSLKDEDQDRNKRKSKKSFKKMSREERFTTSAVSPTCMPCANGMLACLHLDSSVLTETSKQPTTSGLQTWL